MLMFANVIITQDERSFERAKPSGLTHITYGIILTKLMVKYFSK